METVSLFQLSFDGSPVRNRERVGQRLPQTVLFLTTENK